MACAIFDNVAVMETCCSTLLSDKTQGSFPKETKLSHTKRQSKTNTKWKIELDI